MAREQSVPTNLAPEDAAESILAEAVRCNADRVTFPVEATFKFAKVNFDSIRDTLKTFSPYTYRLQQRSGGSWRDVMPGKPNRSINAVIQRVASGTLEHLAVDDIINASVRAPEKFTVGLVKYFRQVSQGIGKKYDVPRLDAELRTLNKVCAAGVHPGTELISTTLLLSREILAAGYPGRPGGNRDSSLQKLIDTVESSAPANADPESSVAVNMILGKLHSFRSRSVAASHFERAKTEGGGLIRQFYIDMGAFTYLSEKAATSDMARQRSVDIVHSIAPAEISSQNGRRAVAYSVDPAFFRIYAPNILFYAQQLPEIDFNFIVCASEEEVDNLIGDAAKYTHALSRLNRSGTAANVNFFHCPVPEYVAEPKTFYASARFYGAALLAREYEDVHLLDADLTAVEDPRPHFESSSTNVLSAVVNAGFSALSPWRRVMAGNVSMSKRVLETTVLEDTQDYISSALPNPDSWMLDQNALAFSFESHSGIVSDLSVRRRPFAQHGFRAAWEDKYFRQRQTLSS